MKLKTKKQWKQILFTTGFFASILAFGSCISFAETTTPDLPLTTMSSSQPSSKNINKVILEIGNAKMSVFNLHEKTPDYKDIDASSQVVPLIKDGRTLLPLRSIVETFGGTASWNSENNCAQININNKELCFYPGNRNFEINGKKKELLVAPEIINGRTYLPLRDFSENTGFVVEWKPADKYNKTSRVEVVKPYKGLLSAYTNDAQGKKWGFIDSEGAFIIKPQYKDVSEFNMYGIAAVETDEGIALINSKGDLLTKPVLSKDNYGVYSQLANENNIIIKGVNNINYVYSPEGTLILETKMNIQSIYDNLISFDDFKIDNKTSGFIDFKGNIVVNADYSYVGSNGNGIYYGSTGYENGDIRTYFNENGDSIKAPESGAESYTPHYSDGMMAYKDSKTNLFGYKDASGKIVIYPKYKFADDFIDGFAYAIISTDQYDEEVVIINKKGKVVFKSDEYWNINNIGNGLFTSGIFQMSVMDAKTAKSFPSKIYTIKLIDDNLVCISDFYKTYFVDANLNKISTMPTFEGYGTVTVNGEILKVSTNKVEGYFKKDGSPIWTMPETTVNVENGIKIHYKKIWPSLGTTITYPVIEGINDKKIEDKINSNLKEIFSVTEPENSEAAEGEEYWSTTDVSVLYGTPILNKDVLIIGEDSYFYGGGAHGSGSSKYINIDLRTGNTFTLDDLIKKNSGFEKFITGYLAKLTGREPEAFSFDDFDRTYSFGLKKDCLELGFPSHKGAFNYRAPYNGNCKTDYLAL